MSQKDMVGHNNRGFFTLPAECSHFDTFFTRHLVAFEGCKEVEVWMFYW
jgi:hypothetical protein